MQGENCNKLKVFLWGPWKGIVSATPAQVNNLIEYCIKMIIWHGYRANNIIVMNTKLLLGVIITPSNNFVFIKSVLSRTCVPSLCNYRSCMVMTSIVS